jgi:hypothetical protein
MRVDLDEAEDHDQVADGRRLEIGAPPVPESAPAQLPSGNGLVTLE